MGKNHGLDPGQALRQIIRVSQAPEDEVGDDVSSMRLYDLRGRGEENLRNLVVFRDERKFKAFLQGRYAGTDYTAGLSLWDFLLILGRIHCVLGEPRVS